MIYLHSITYFFLFLVGNFGLFYTNRSIILIIMCLELIILSGSLNFIISAIYLDDIYGLIVGIIALTVAAAESSIALAIVLFYNKQRTNLSIYSN